MKRVILLLLVLGLVSPNLLGGTYKLTTGDNFPPYTGRDLPQGGMITEIIEVVFKEMGHHTHIRFLPWKRGYYGATHAKYAGTFPYVKNDDRLRDFHYSNVIYTVLTRIFVKKGSLLQYRTEDDLKGNIICSPLGYALNNKILPLIEQKLVKQVNPVSMGACFGMIERGRATFVTLQEARAWPTIQKVTSREKFQMLEKPIDKFSYYFIVSKAYTDGVQLLEEFNKALSRLQLDGKIEEIINRHLI